VLKPSAEEMLDCRMPQRTLQMCLKSGVGSRTFCNWRQRVPDSWCHGTECLGL